MRRYLLTLLAAVLVVPSAFGDELLIDQVHESKKIEVRRGRTMEQIKQRHGEPENVKGPVGQPPITRWVYDDFTIYFERDRALHAVVRR